MYRFSTSSGSTWEVKEGRLALLDPQGHPVYGDKGRRSVVWITPPADHTIARYRFPSDDHINTLSVEYVHHG